MKRKIMQDMNIPDNAVAIVGMSCRLPGGCNTYKDFWKFLKRRGNGIREVPEDRWNLELFYHENPESIARSISKWAGFLDDIQTFDATHFGISPREAASMDPQQRLLLEASCEAMQDAKRPPEYFSQKLTGVFVGISQSDYRGLQEFRLTTPENYAGTGYALCINANRISHRLNLTGPSYSVDTACSSSMVALDQAIKNLHAGACEIAVVAGVNVLVHPSSFVAFSRAGMLSPNGNSAPFDAKANGFVRGEGVGVVIIKPYANAIADGDRIHAVIRATVVNQDGYTSTITAPNQAAQFGMLDRLTKDSGVPRDHLGYVEAHGTGTPIGDPIEAGAIGQAIGQHVARPINIGSVKANVGHLESGAGITGLIKATLCVQHSEIPPHPNFHSANPNIPLDALNLAIPKRLEAFPEFVGARHAVINSFGFGGTNACAFISSTPSTRIPQYRGVTVSPKATFPLFFPISAQTANGIAKNAASLLQAMTGKRHLADASLDGISRALATQRSHYSNRVVVIARTKTELRAALSLIAKGDAETIERAENIAIGQVQNPGGLCFMFSGQGSQWWAMGREFLEGSQIFRKTVDAFDKEFRKAAGWSIIEELLRNEEDSRIDDTTVTQPALFAIQIGLAALWKNFGIEPNMVIGHSIGEAGAAHVAQGLSLEGAAAFLSKRGMIRDQLGVRGAMAAIGLNHEDVEAILPQHGRIGVAAINGPGSTTVSGDYDAVHEFIDELKTTYPDSFIRILKVDTAWHSYQLDFGKDWFDQEVPLIDWKTPDLLFISTVSGKLESRFDNDYAWRNLRSRVEFQSGIETAVQLGAITFVELGPHATLAGPTTSTAMEKGLRPNVFQSLRRGKPDFDTFAMTAASLFVSGHALDWEGITSGQPDDVELPAYTWNGEKFWKGSEEADVVLNRPYQNPFLGQRYAAASNLWRSEINLKAYAFLRDHQLQSDVIFPGAAYIDAFLAMGHEFFGPKKTIEVQNLIVNDAMFIPTEGDLLFNTTYEVDRGHARFYSRQRDTREDWVLRAEAIVRPANIKTPRSIKFDLQNPALTAIDLADVYCNPDNKYFINYGDAFQVIQELWMTSKRSIARITFPEKARAAFGKHLAHPAMLDGALQIVEPFMTLEGIRHGRKPGDNVYLPVGAGKIRLFAPFPDEIFVHTEQVQHHDGPNALSSFVVTDSSGSVLMTADDLEMRALPTKVTERETDEVKPSFVVQHMVEVRDDSEKAPIVSPKKGHWLLLAEPSKAAEALQSAMVGQGARVDILPRETLGERVSEALSDRYGEAFEAGRITGIIFAWPLSIPTPSELTSCAEMLKLIEDVSKDLVSVGDLMDFHRMCSSGLARIIILTGGAHAMTEGEIPGPQILTQAPFVAMGRGIATETPEYTVRMIDCDQNALEQATDLAVRILSENAETEIAMRSGKVFAPRLTRSVVDEIKPKLMKVVATDDRTNFHCTMRSPGAIDGLELCELPTGLMATNQVRVRIRAVGLNFRDVMAVTGLLPREAEPDPAHQHLGLEFGAIVEEVGEAVEGFTPGDRVMGLGRRCLQRFMIVDPRTLTKLPDHISLEEAATIPSAFATAHYSLNHVGRMRAGDKVLIHVATGGVGSAAVQLAQAKGAEILATAGSPKKRKILRDQKIRYVFDSRTLNFADAAMRATKGKGVDILLNSLPGDFVTKGLDIMAPYGRFLEIGKRDVYADSSIGMRALRRNSTLSVIDLASMGGERPELLAEIFDELIALFREKELVPLPFTSFPISKICEAFRFMSQAKHVGKVVVTFDEPAFEVRRDPARAMKLRNDAVYLITGGTRGFCLDIADWMSRSGAGKLILASRSGAIDPLDEKKCSRISARGTKVETISLDVTDAKAVSALLKRLKREKHPLRGIVHGAAVIKDGFANQLTDEMISDVLAPKIAGGWNLHRALTDAGIEPDFLVGFSSIAPVLGSAGQINYIAGNAFLDALALYRQSRGQQGSAINWGAIGQAGFVARSESLASYLESLGLVGLSKAEAEKGIEALLSREITSLVYAKADWQKIAGANPSLGQSPRFASLISKNGVTNSQFRMQLMQLEGDALRAEAEEYVISEICAVLKIEKAAIKADRPMSELGLDSLSFFELKMRIETGLDMVLPVSKFLKAPTIGELKEILSEEIEILREAEAQAAIVAEAEGLEGSDVPNDSMKVILPTHAQEWLFQDALAPMSTNSARLALEHRVNAYIPARTSEAEVLHALAKVKKRHPMLRLRPSTQRPETLTTLEDHGPRLVEGPDIGALDLENSEFVRVNFDPGDGETFLSVRMHHALGDRESAHVVISELAALLKDESLPRLVPRRALVKLTTDCRFDPDSANGQNDRSFWYYSMLDEPRPVNFPKRGRVLAPVGMGRNHGPPIILEAAISGSLMEHEVLVALARSLRSATRSSGSVLISRACSLRKRLPKGSAIGPFDILQPLVVTDDPSNKVAISGLLRTLQHAQSHTAFDSYAAAQAFRVRFDRLQVTPFQFGFAMSGRGDPYLTASEAGTAFDLAAEITGDEGARRLRLSFDSDVLDTSTARKILRSIVRTRALTNTDSAPSKAHPIA